MRKTIFVLDVNDYAPEIKKLTYPFIVRYASRIGAYIQVISERKYPEYPPVYEKLQIRDSEVAHTEGYNIYFDIDTLIHPQALDITMLCDYDTVMHNGVDLAWIRWTYDKYFERDGRNIGSCNWCTVSSHLTVDDLYTPLEHSAYVAVKSIHPTIREENSGIITPEHLIDDYTLSRNIARFGLKVTTVIDQMKERGMEDFPMFWHAYDISINSKIEQMKDIIAAWKRAGTDAGPNDSNNNL